MQTSILMTYLDSTHFSDKFSYKILFISNYSLKDTNRARFKHLQQYLAKQRKPGTFLIGKEPARVVVRWDQRMLTWRLRNKEAKIGGFYCRSGVRTPDVLNRNKGSDQPDTSSVLKRIGSEI
jgi:hypothetical protein